MTQKWFCVICSYVHVGEEPPDECPVCKAKKNAFRPMPTMPDGREASESRRTVQLPARSADVEAETDQPSLTLEDIRDKARERLMGVCAVYPHCDGDDERICNREAYGKAIGFGGAGMGRSFAANIQALEALKLVPRLVGDATIPQLSLSLFGLELSMPILAASVSGVSRYTNAVEEGTYQNAVLSGCRNAGTLGLMGDTYLYTVENNPALDALEDLNGHGIPVFKPRAQDILHKLFRRAEAAKARAIGVDLDGCGSTNMAAAGQPVFRKSKQELAELVQSTELPVLFKGIMSVDDAKDCVEAGAAAIGVSNHGGRVLDCTPGVAEVLPEIVKAVGGNVLIFADGGIRTGLDAFKYLALGATAVLAGRDIVRAAVGGEAQGVALQLERYKKGLAHTMTMTGYATVKGINNRVFFTKG